MYIDVHTHLTHKAFEKDQKEVIENSNCIVLINNGYTSENNRETLELAKRYKQVKVALGIHPSETQKMSMEEVDNEIDFISKQKMIAIGEVGLDYKYENQEHQRKVFRKLVKLAKKKGLPVIVHSRKAEKDVIDILEEEGLKKVVLHCFSGKLKLVDRAEKLGYHFSIPPCVVNSEHFQQISIRVSITQLLTETDAPYLGPIRGERNEPKYVALAVKKIAEVKGMDEEEVKRSIFLNYQRLFLA
jgi:TatD DNase family protein